MAWSNNYFHYPSYRQFQPLTFDTLLQTPPASFLMDQRSSFMTVDIPVSMETFDPALMALDQVPLRYAVDSPEPLCVNPADLIAQPAHLVNSPDTSICESSPPPSPVSPQFFEHYPSPSTTNTSIEMTPPPAPRPPPAGDEEYAVRLSLGLRSRKRTAAAFHDDNDDNDDDDDDGDDDNDSGGDEDHDDDNPCCNRILRSSVQSAPDERPVAGRAGRASKPLSAPRTKKRKQLPHCVSAYPCPEGGLCGSSGSFDTTSLTGSHHIYEPVPNDHPEPKYLHKNSGIWFACVGVCKKSYGRSPEAGRHTVHVPYVSEGMIVVPAESCPRCNEIFRFMRRDSLHRHLKSRTCREAYAKLVNGGSKDPTKVEAQVALLRKREPRRGVGAAVEDESDGAPPKKKARTRNTQSAPAKKPTAGGRKKAQRAK